MTNVKLLNDQELLSKIKYLIAEENKNVAAQIVILKEVRQRKLAIALGYPNLLEFCVAELGLTRDQAWKRSQAAGAVEKEPVLLDILNQGQTSVSALAALAGKLSVETAAEIKKFVPNKSKREVEAFVSNLRRDGSRENRQPTVKVVLNIEPATLEKLELARKLLKQNTVAMSQEEVLDHALELLLDKKDPRRKAARAKKRVEVKNGKIMAKKSTKMATTAGAPAPGQQGVAVAAPAPGQQGVAVAAPAPGQQGVAVAAPAPGQQGVAVAAPAPEQQRVTAEKLGRYIPARTRHKLLGTDDYRCQFVGCSGKRCSETRALQMDHIEMFCRGGGHDENNLRLMCPTHNRYMAEQTLGWSHVP